MMKTILTSIFFGFSLIHALALDTTIVLNTDMFKPVQDINLASLDGWIYHQGNNLAWAKQNIRTTEWQRLKPADLSVKYADETGRVEGWFRLKISLDSTFEGLPVNVDKSSWAAVDLYVDGRLIASFGNTGSNGKPYQEHYPYYVPHLPVNLIPGRDHLIAIHFVDYISPFSSKKLKSELEDLNKHLLLITGPESKANWLSYCRSHPVYVTLWMSISLIMTILFWLLSFQDLYEKKVIRLLAIWGTLSTIGILGDFVDIFEPAFVIEVIFFRLSTILYFVSVPFLIIALLRILAYTWSPYLNCLIIVISAIGGFLNVYYDSNTPGSIANSVQFLVFLYFLLSSWNKLRGAQWAIVTGAILTNLFNLAFAVATFDIIEFDRNTVNTGLFLPLPLSFIIYITLRFKEILAEVREKAAAVLQVTEEKREVLATQNQQLEQQVEARTSQLSSSLSELKASQAQLIQKEKLASLGELTAGIAHEIQNPLNFVNNFSQVSVELVTELEDEQQKPDRDPELEAELLGDLKQNLQKISHHGGRASSIVKGMLEHSRTGTGERQPTDLNALADEYLRLAYHGLRAKEQTFNAHLRTDFDPNSSFVNVVPQEIGRVLLNLFNNAFYAVKERSAWGKGQGLDYQPTVWVSTKVVDQHVEIRVRDNGAGIPESVKTKIFQPFFTTKPTGEGTGLGLSLSYDIVTKGHGGSLNVTSVEGEGSEFIITLPIA